MATQDDYDVWEDPDFDRDPDDYDDLVILEQVFPERRYRYQEILRILKKRAKAARNAGEPEKGKYWEAKEREFYKSFKAEERLWNNRGAPAALDPSKSSLPYD